MWVYWVMFAIPSAAAAARVRMGRFGARVAWGLVAFLFIAAIGLRHNTGGDWVTYSIYFQEILNKNLAEIATGSDPGYYVLNWLVAYSGANIYIVNLICATIIVTGVIAFCRKQSDPVLAYVSAIPYLLIVVAMGYTRQSVSIGCFLFGIMALERGRIGQFVLWCLAALLFHRSAILLLPLALAVSGKGRGLTILAVVALAFGGYWFAVRDTLSGLENIYIRGDMQSNGAVARAAMSALAAGVLLFFRSKLIVKQHTGKFWLIMCWLSIISLAAAPIASTIVDRVGLYLIPVQLLCCGNVRNISKSKWVRYGIGVGVIICYGVALGVWLTNGDYAERWIPYRAMIP